MKIEFSSQKREMLLFLTTNVAAVTSRANRQFSLFSLNDSQSFLGNVKYSAEKKLSQDWKKYSIALFTVN